MKCIKCQRELKIAPEQVGIDGNGMPIFHRFGYCDNCFMKWDLDQQFYAPFPPNAKKRHSALSCVACGFASVSVIFPMIIFVGYILSLIGGILGVVDLCMFRKHEKHIGSWFALIVFIVWNVMLFAIS